MNESEAVKRFKAVLRSPMLQMNLLAALTGICAAVLTWVFISLSKGIQGIFYGDSFIHNSLVDSKNEWMIIFIPALGGLVAGLIIEYWSKDAKGVGVPLVMEAVAFKQARLSAKKAIAKCFAAAACIGTGMSLGRVGPMVVISSTVGSEIGQRTGKTVDETRTLVGCGAASAITAAFNAPLGGVLFAIELILAELRTRSFIPIVVAAVIATTVGRGLTGDVAASYIDITFCVNSHRYYAPKSCNILILFTHWFIQYICLIATMIWIPSQDGGWLCDPDTLLQGHALWHLLGAVAMWSFYKYFRTEVDNY